MLMPNYEEFDVSSSLYLKSVTRVIKTTIKTSLHVISNKGIKL